MKKILISCFVFYVSIFCLLVPCAQAEILADLQGHWIVNFEATLANAKNSPKYNPEEDERMPEMIKDLMERMSMDITPSEVIYYRGMEKNDEGKAIGFEVDALEENTATLIMTGPADQIARLTFTLLGDGLMSFQSSQTDDFDYYVWQKVE